MATSFISNKFFVIKQLFFVFVLTIIDKPVYSQTESANEGQHIVEYTSIAGLPSDSVALFAEPFFFTEGLSSLSKVETLKIQIPKISFYRSEALPSLYGSSIQNPFMSAYSLNSMAIYWLSDKLSLTGSSFSANSVFGAQPPNFSPDQMNIHGINFHLEYKISDKVRVGGGLQIYQEANGL